MTDFLPAAIALIVAALRAGNKVLACGNGGSAAQASHFVGELVGRFAFDRPPLAAISLNADTTVMTALANDYGYERVFSRQVAALGKSGDVLVAISTSGESENVVRAAQQARIDGLHVLALTGARGGRLALQVGDLTKMWHTAPTNVTPLVQEDHMRVLHALAEAVEIKMFRENR